MYGISFIRGVEQHTVMNSFVVNDAGNSNTDLGWFRKSEDDGNYVYKNVTHSNRAIEEFNSMRKEDVFCDVTLIAGELRMKGHRALLSSYSKYFYVMFTGNFRERTQTEIIINDVDPHILELVIDYMYTGEITFSDENHVAILTAANLFQMSDLKVVCISFMEQYLNPKNCISTRAVANLYDCKKLESKAESFVIGNFAEVLKETDYLELSVEEILKFIQNDEIYITEEEQVFNGVKNWINHDIDRKRFAQTLMLHVRFPLMKREFLEELLTKERSILENLECLQKVQEAFLSIPVNKEEDDEESIQTRLPTRPRQWLDPKGLMVVNKSKSYVRCFEFRSRTWIPLKSTPTSRLDSAIAETNNKVYILGGMFYRSRRRDDSDSDGDDTDDSDNNVVGVDRNNDNNVNGADRNHGDDVNGANHNNDNVDGANHNNDHNVVNDVDNANHGYNEINYNDAVHDLNNYFVDNVDFEHNGVAYDLENDINYPELNYVNIRDNVNENYGNDGNYNNDDNIGVYHPNEYNVRYNDQNNGEDYENDDNIGVYHPNEYNVRYNDRDHGVDYNNDNIGVYHPSEYNVSYNQVNGVDYNNDNIGVYHPSEYNVRYNDHNHGVNYEYGDLEHNGINVNHEYDSLDYSEGNEHRAVGYNDENIVNQEYNHADNNENNKNNGADCGDSNTDHEHSSADNSVNHSDGNSADREDNGNHLNNEDNGLDYNSDDVGIHSEHSDDDQDDSYDDYDTSDEEDSYEHEVVHGWNYGGYNMNHVDPDQYWQYDEASSNYGYHEADYMVAVNTVDVYNVETDKWEVGVPMHSKRYKFSAATMKGKIYAVGGMNKFGMLKSAEVYDPVSRIWGNIAPMLESRADLSVCTMNNRLYALGGNRISGANTVECYNPETNEWHYVAPMPSNRCKAGACALNGILYVVGGYDGDHYLKSAAAYDPKSDSWRLLADMHHKRSNFDLIPHSGKLYAVGGDYCGTTSTIEIYSPEENAWSVMQMPNGKIPSLDLLLATLITRPPLRNTNIKRMQPLQIWSFPPGHLVDTDRKIKTVLDFATWPQG